MKYLAVLLFLMTPVLYGKQKDVVKPTNGRATTLEKGLQESASKSAVKKVEPQEMPATLVMGTVEQWRVRAEERYPDLKAPASEFSVAFERSYKVTQTENPRFLVANDWPVRLAEIVARQLKEPKPGTLAVVRR